MLRRLERMRRLRTACNASSSAADLSARWEGGVLAHVSDNSRPMSGRLELISSHLLLADDGGQMLFALPFSFMLSLQRKRELHFQTRTFAELPRIKTIVEISTANGPVTVTMEGPAGGHVAKAIEAQWRRLFGQLTTREAQMFRCYGAGDVLYALSMLPLDVECNLAQKVSGGRVTAVDRPVVLRVDENFKLSIIMRPNSFAEMFDLYAIKMDLDEAELIYGKGDEIRLIDAQARTYMFNNTFEPQSVIPQLMSVFLANAATMAYRQDNMLKEVAPFTHDEAAKLFDQYLVVDENLDGSISRTEFMVSLGPIVAKESALADALYNLFDCFNRKQIRVFEYLHGSRVLLRGDVEDRLHFIFGLFDTKRRSQISMQQFTTGVRILNQTISIKVPRGETIETFANNIFQRMDADNSGDVSFDEFKLALTNDLGVIDAMQSVVYANNDATAGATSKVISFGHARWHEITHIMSGIELSVLLAEGGKPGQANAPPMPAAPASPLDQPAFASKVSFDTVQGTIVGKDGASQSSFRKLTGGGPAVVFNDYAPAAFAMVRKQFGISKEAYLASLGSKQLKNSLVFGSLTSLFEMSSSGRSGSFFYTSHDGKYVLKTIPAGEADTLRRILPAYCAHIAQYPDTLVTRFTGLHAMVRGTAKIYFVVMSNIFQNKLAIHETYDLKGSTVNRSTPMEIRAHGVALKDNDFHQRKLRVVPALKAELLKQATLDSLLLSKLNLNDYSFLLGIHRSDGVLPPSAPSMCPKPSHSRFQLFHGGVPNSSKTEVLFFGVIDILTAYNVKKMGEHIGKSVLYDGTQVSCVPPDKYHDRFVRYLDSILVTGDG
jgi:Ca2+-binding EF-hand superfamily protein